MYIYVCIYFHVHQKVGFQGFLMDGLVVCVWLSGQSHPQVYGVCVHVCHDPIEFRPNGLTVHSS